MSSLFKRSSRDRDKKQPKGRVASSSSASPGFTFNELNAPTKVIQATHSYIAQRPGELSFKAGDFFHILNSTDSSAQWIEAHNPIKNVKGKVPSAYFKVFEKTHNSVAGQAAGGRLSGNSSTSSNSLQKQQSDSHDSHLSVTSQKKVAPLPSLYGRVLYDFQAERPDELSVFAGDSVIICAHHDYEWFIGKFLDKIGEPGLIPVTYVQLFDITTRVPYRESTKQVIEQEHLPTVDEWKTIKNKHKASARAVGSAASTTNRNQQHEVYESLSRSSSTTNRYQQQELSKTHAVSINIESFSNTNGKYWYLVRVVLSNGTVRNLCRYYEDFFNFHQAVLSTWPREGGRFDTNERKDRIIPFIPGPLIDVSESLCHKRLIDLDVYLKTTIQLPDYISKSKLINSFFEIKDGDQEFSDQSQVRHMEGVIKPSRSPPSMIILNWSESSQAAHQAPALELSKSSSAGSGNNTRNSQYQQDRLSQYENTKNGPPYAAKSGAPSQQQKRLSSLSSNNSNGNLKGSSEQQSLKLKLKFYYKDDIFAISVPTTITLLQLKELIVPRIDESEEVDIVERLIISEKGKDAAITNDQELWECNGFVDKGKFEVFV
ncbi:hypothetical protein CANARDRAFT_196156 [[Candida] arabinofermentans NRRL YB-2248]|uniref:Bud emergence protein 1 n=1 Tax=[Candida] arabinofermentans NRRL YB-2248 TaxID=983967 RepID=A0A1E4T5A7_9ASCO|nr:hypothetical protein CANARDRAFT_196156 [[Candida] arabinofermentans NRRL YB-2248]